MITRQQLRDVVRRQIDLQIDTNSPQLSRHDRRALANETHRKAWRKSKGRNMQLAAAIIEKQRKDTAKANEIIAQLA